MNSKKKILVIAPHADDEVLGCGGYLLHQSKAGAEIGIIIGTIGGKDSRQDYSVRKKEFDTVCDCLNAKGCCMFRDKDAMLDTIPSVRITSALDKAIDAMCPDEIFLNYRSRHQDHIKMYDCTMASLRLREGYMPKLIALYEYSFVADGLQMPLGGSMYHDITDNIRDKIVLFSLYKSQIRKPPSPLNHDGIRTLAAFRGMECGVQYAEKFYIQKMMV